MSKSTSAQEANKAPTRCPLSRYQRLSVAVAALGVDERTVIAAYVSPTRVRESSLRRIREAARNLGFPQPELVGEERS